MPASHNPPPKPSLLVALISLAVVRRLRPDWVAVSLSTAAADCGMSAQRLSRLASGAILPFEEAVVLLCRRGRPPVDRQANADSETAITAALCTVATALLSQLRLRGEAVRALIVGAYLRLQTAHPKLTQKRFCATLALPQRTLRHWLSTTPRRQAPPAPTPPEPPQRGRERGLRRPRFGFDVTVPDTQVAADTTQLEAFGVKLALVAAQDVGGRDQDLLDAVIVDDHECADTVVAVLETAVGGKLGQQVVTDQGTPYLAERTREAIDALDADHAIQREGDPLGKATIERAFGTVKSIAAPLLALTNELAQRLPALRHTDLACAATTLLLTLLLRAYQAGARATRRANDARGGLDEQALARVAEANRERARAEHRSARLLLTRLHSVHQLDGKLQRFIRDFRRVPLPVLHDAEHAFAVQAHRGDIAKRTAFFAAIVTRLWDAYRARQARRARNRRLLERLRGQRRSHHAREAAWDGRPHAQLAAALDLLAAQYLPSLRTLLAGGAGLGRAWLRAALARLRRLHDSAAVDIALGTFSAFAEKNLDTLGQDGITAVEVAFRTALSALTTPPSTHHCAARLTCAILGKTGPRTRPETSSPLRI